MYDEIKQIIDTAKKILIIQADNPDADSLASSLALESILSDLDKQPIMYCGIDIPEYLRYLPGWDRVQKEIPSQFDASIIVDISTITLLEQLSKSGSQSWVASKPCIVIDHHTETKNDISFASVVINDSNKVSTGELIYDIAKSIGLQLPLDALEFIATSILADSLGLITENTTSDTYRVMAALIDAGVSRPKLEEMRREYNKMHPKIFKYKAELIQRTEIIDDAIAVVVIPQNEINEYSPLHNPGPLIQGDHLQTKGVLISIVLKNYDSGRITATIRCNNGAPIASRLAESFGGGGHEYASGFKIENGDISRTKQDSIQKAKELLDEIA